MSAVVPHRLLFRYSIPVLRVGGLPKPGRLLLDLPPECVLPGFGELDGEPTFGAIGAAWNERGIGFSVRVSGKREPVSCHGSRPEESDGLQLWIDTRNTQSIHRASRFCHEFCFLPAGGGKKGTDPMGVQLPVARAREEAPITPSEKLRVSAEIFSDGYRMEAWLGAEQLHGFDPEANPLLGFYCCVRDAELGEQFLTVGREFPFSHDPSLWSTLELVGGNGK